MKLEPLFQPWQQPFDAILKEVGLPLLVDVPVDGCRCYIGSRWSVLIQHACGRRDSMLSPMIVMLLRLLTSAEIQRRTDFFAPFVMVRPCTCPVPNTSTMCRVYHVLRVNTVDAWLWWAPRWFLLRVLSMCQIMRQCTTTCCQSLVQRMLTVLDAVLCRACATMMSPCSSSAPDTWNPWEKRATTFSSLPSQMLCW